MKERFFLGKKGTKQFILLLVILFSFMILERVLNYNYLLIQKEVQEGNYDYWHQYLTVGIYSTLTSLACTLLIVFANMWLVKTQKVNFFKRYDGIIQTGKKEICLRKFNYENAKINTLIETIQAIMSIVYTAIIMRIVNMTVPQMIGAGAILVAGIVLGVRRGNLQQEADVIGANIQVRQELLSNHFMISSHVLNERLEEVDKGYWKQMRTQIMKNLIRGLPEVIKVICFIALMWAIVDTKVTEGTVYSYSYIIFVAYGYIVSFANEIGNIVEDVSKLLKYKKDEKIIALEQEEKERKSQIGKLVQKVYRLKDELVIETGFTANVSHSNRKDSWYFLSENLTIKKGQMVQLEGENETGKSRFNRLLRELIPDAILYDSNTAMSNQLAENFTNGKKIINFKLIKYLANGIGISGRIPDTMEDFKKVKFDKQLNSADIQRLLAVQILYFAIMEHQENPEKLQVIILDEILSNISEQNAQKVIEFIKQELSKIGGCTIIVSHTHKEAVRKCVSQTWYMRNEGDKIVVEVMK